MGRSMQNRSVARALVVACGALGGVLVTLPDEALALPRDRAARRLGRLLPPGSVVVVPPAAAAPTRRARGPLAATAPAAQPAPRAAAAGLRPAGPPAPQPGTAQGVGGAPAGTGVTPAAAEVPAPATPQSVAPAPKPTPVPVLEPAADGTRSVLVPGGGAATDAPIELLPVP